MIPLTTKRYPVLTREQPFFRSLTLARHLEYELRLKRWKQRARNKPVCASRMRIEPLKMVGLWASTRYL